MKSPWITFGTPCQYEYRPRNRPSLPHRQLILRGWIIAWRYDPKDTATGYRLQYLSELGEMIVIKDGDEMEFFT